MKYLRSFLVGLLTLSSFSIAYSQDVHEQANADVLYDRNLEKERKPDPILEPNKFEEIKVQINFDQMTKAELRTMIRKHEESLLELQTMLEIARRDQDDDSHYGFTVNTTTMAGLAGGIISTFFFVEFLRDYLVESGKYVLQKEHPNWPPLKLTYPILGGAISYAMFNYHPAETAYWYKWGAIFSYYGGYISGGKLAIHLYDFINGSRALGLKNGLKSNGLGVLTWSMFVALFYNIYWWMEDGRVKEVKLDRAHLQELERLSFQTSQELQKLREALEDGNQK